VHLEIIATTYHSTIFKTHVFSSHSHLCIYIAIHLHTVYLNWLQAGLECNSRSAWKWQLSGLSDTPHGDYRATLEMHLEAIIERIWRYTGRPCSSELRDALQDRDRASLEINLEAVIERVWRCTWRPWSCELGGRDRASLEMHLAAIIMLTWRT